MTTVKRETKGAGAVMGGQSAAPAGVSVAVVWDTHWRVAAAQGEPSRRQWPPPHRFHPLPAAQLGGGGGPCGPPQLRSVRVRTKYRPKSGESSYWRRESGREVVTAVRVRHTLA